MKKGILLLLAVIVVVALSACQGAKKAETDKAGAPETAQVTETPKATEQIETTPTAEPIFEEPTEEATEEPLRIDVFIEAFNQAAATPMVEVTEIDLFDREGGHYRTEFRLSAFSGARAKSGKIGDIVLDVIECGIEKDELRLYADGLTGEQAAEIVRYAAPIMDPNLSAGELQAVLDYLNGVSSYHNGYLGALCMTFNRTSGEWMLRTD